MLCGVRVCRRLLRVVHHTALPACTQDEDSSEVFNRTAPEVHARRRVQPRGVDGSSMLTQVRELKQKLKRTEEALSALNRVRACERARVHATVHHVLVVFGVLVGASVRPRS